jgi:Transcriptional regulator containing an amidase domain and an AraC-type DNA-binding HTH domain
MSERTLQRVTATAMGVSPVEFVNEVRLDEAAFLLRSTALSADAVAARVGFQNAGTLRALVRRRRGVTLRELRRGSPTPHP